MLYGQLWPQPKHLLLSQEGGQDCFVIYGFILNLLALRMQRRKWEVTARCYSGPRWQLGAVLLSRVGTKHFAALSAMKLSCVVGREQLSFGWCCFSWPEGRAFLMPAFPWEENVATEQILMGTWATKRREDIPSYPLFPYCDCQNINEPAPFASHQSSVRVIKTSHSKGCFLRSCRTQYEDKWWLSLLEGEWGEWLLIVPASLNFNVYILSASDA